MTDTNPLRSFREPNVRIFFGGLVVSNVGTWIHTTAAILLVRDLGGGGVELGIVTACQFLPMLVLGLWAGAFADRHDRYRLLIVLQLLMGAVAVALGAVDLAGGASIPVVYAFSALIGLLATFDNPSRRTLATELVPAGQLANIVALSTSIMTGGRIVGPALAAAIALNFGTAWAFLLNGASFLVFVGAMTRLDRSRFHPIERAAPSRSPVRDGLAAVWGQPALRFVVVGFALVSTFTYNYLVGLPLLVEERLGQDPEVFAVLLSAMSVGNVIGSLTVARLTTVSRHWIFGAAGVLGVALALLALSTSVVAALVLVVVMGAGSTAYVNTSTIHIQQTTDPAVRGRVLALTSVLFLGSTPIGGPITGVIGDVFGALWANLYGAFFPLALVAIGVVLERRQRVAQASTSSWAARDAAR